MTGIAVINKYFPGLTDHQQEQFIRLHLQLTKWNSKLNLISRKDTGSLYLKHVLHSLAIARFIEFVPRTTIMDAGTGGGFPGLPLAIYFPESEFLLVDSTGKKINAVTRMAGELELKNVTTRKARIEDIPDKFDYIVARAVTRLKALYHWTGDKIKNQHRNSIKNGIICLKGGDLTDEIEEIEQTVEVIGIKHYFTESFFETKKIVFIPKE